MRFEADPPIVHTVHPAPGAAIALTIYEWAILQRIVRDEPVRLTPHAAEAVGRLAEMGLIERVGERLTATKLARHALMLLRFQDGYEPPVLEWMDEPYRDAEEWHRVCEDIFLRNADQWEKMESG